MPAFMQEWWFLILIGSPPLLTLFAAAPGRFVHVFRMVIRK
jgi:hypothetical protein